METYEKDTKVSDTSIEAFNRVFRKYAHLVAYLVLGILVANSFYESGARGLKMIAFTMLLCLVYALSDEIHQAFVPGRGTQLRDILIDGIGAMVGTLIYKGIIR